MELKEVKLREGYYVMDPIQAVEMVDENTICVAYILGSTLNEEFEDVKLLKDFLIEKNKLIGAKDLSKITSLSHKIRWDTPIHVDAANGGFIAPFIYLELEWDFRLPLVKSINVSGQKYGLVHAGIGWVIWRTKQDLPEELIFTSIILVLINLLLLSISPKGHRNVMKYCRKNAIVLRKGF